MLKCYKCFEAVYKDGRGVSENEYNGFEIMDETDEKVTEVKIIETFCNWADVIKANNYIHGMVEVAKTRQGLEIHFKDFTRYKGRYTYPETIKECEDSKFNLQIGFEYREICVSLKDILNYKDGELAARWLKEHGLGFSLK